MAPRLRLSVAPLVQILAVSLLAGVLLVSCASEARPPPPDPIGSRIEAHVRELASSRYAGRAPGTPGGEKAAAYIEHRLKASGLEPAGSQGFRHPVPLQGMRTLASTRLVWSGSLHGVGENGGGSDARDPGGPEASRGSMDVSFEAFLAGWNRPVERSTTEGLAVFVGYGIVDGESGRDDLGEVDLTGKWAVALDGLPADLAGTLSHSAGQPVSKLHAAARRGAIGLVILAHALEWSEPYGLAREERILPGWSGREGGQPIPWVAVRGAVLDSLSGLHNLWEEALAPGFRPRPLAGRLRLELVQTVRRFESPNLLARLPGSDPALASRHVCLSAHYDGLGRSGERIYPGVIDNAIGVAELLEVATLARQEGAPRRSLLFFFPTAEEAGLLGSHYFVENPTLPLDDLVGCLNKDGAPEAWGRSRDVIAIAAGAVPSFAASLRADVARLGLAWSANPFPSEGFFFRSDHYSFLRAGVPSLLLFLGLAFEDRPPAWGTEQAMLYLREHYHRSTDDLSRVMTWEGPAQYARLWLALARDLADGEELPREEIDLSTSER